MIAIRSFRPADADAVRALFARGQLDFAEGTPLDPEIRRYIELSLAADLSDIPANYLHRPKSGFWVAEQDSTVKGTVGIQRVDDSEAELRRMSVASDARRQGIGRRLLETVEEFCRREGFARIALSTVIHLEPAVKMYAAHGFEATHQEPFGPMTIQYFVKQL